MDICNIKIIPLFTDFCNRRLGFRSAYHHHSSSILIKASSPSLRAQAAALGKRNIKACAFRSQTSYREDSKKESFVKRQLKNGIKKEGSPNGLPLFVAWSLKKGTAMQSCSSKRTQANNRLLFPPHVVIVTHAYSICKNYFFTATMIPSKPAALSCLSISSAFSCFAKLPTCTRYR